MVRRRRSLGLSDVGTTFLDSFSPEPEFCRPFEHFTTTCGDVSS
jgi:hypothetical protein